MGDALRKNHVSGERESYQQHEKVSTKSKSVNRKKRRTYEFIDVYQQFLQKSNYSISTIRPHLERTNVFVEYFAEVAEIHVNSLTDLQTLTMHEIRLYEKYLMGRVSRKEIKDETAYSCIKNLRLFIKFLKNEGVINFKYNIPKKFITSPTRLNSYIPSDLLLELIQVAQLDQSAPRYRTLAIISLLINTGCRPVEISNLKIHDVRLSEKTITLHSIKSGKYTLTLNNFVIDTLKKYLRSRNKISAKCDNLFVKNNGELLASTNISSIIYYLNIKAFGKPLVNARSIRHTHITNAIDNGNEFYDISLAVGHKHWESTLYYLHRSEERLLANTMSFNPLQNLLEE